MNPWREKLQTLPAAARWLVAAACLGLALPAQASKPGSGVTVRAELPKTLKVGEQGTLKLRVSEVSAADGASVEVRDPATGETLFQAALARGEARSFDVPFTARRDGVQHLDIVTRQGTRASVKSLPVAVGHGAADLKTEGKPMLTPSGERIISLPSKP